MSLVRAATAVVAVAACFVAAMAFGSGSADAGEPSGVAPASRGASWVVGTEPTNVVLVSDSALAGMRWTNSLHGLTGTSWDTRLESCRRLVYPSCRGREGYAPPTLLEELRAIIAAGGVGEQEILLVGVGYNDWESRFSADVDSVLWAARRAGFQRVGWLTYRTAVSYALPGNVPTEVANYAAMNQVLAQKAASGRWPELVVLDYARHTAHRHSWFAADGVHLTASGAWFTARWLSDVVQFATTPALAPDNWRPAD